MQLIHNGKTKTVYSLDNDRVLIVFKDDVTGTEAGVDPGGNTVVGQMPGKGRIALKQSLYFFELLATHGIPTHYLSIDLDQSALTARRATWLGLEFVVRFKAYGSFVRRYGKYVKEGTDLGLLVEITLKDDQRGDPLIVDEALDALGIMTAEQVREAKVLVQQAAQVIHADLQSKGLDLLDLKFECGMVDGQLVIIDDISTDNMRVTSGGKAVSPEQLLEATVGASE